MSVEKRYFKYHFTKRLPTLLIVLAISLWFVFSSSISEYGTYDEALDDFLPTLLLGPASTVLGMMSVFMPMAEFSMFKKRKDLDNLFSLPISRERMLGVHFLTGLITNAVVFVSCVIVVFFCGLSIDLPLSTLVYLIPYCLLQLLWGTVMYAFFTFIFYEGNTAADGAIFVWAHCGVPLMFLGGIAALMEIVGLDQWDWFLEIAAGMSPISPFAWISSSFEELVCPVEDVDFFLELTPDLSSWLTGTVFYLVAGILAGVAFFRYSGKKRVEHTGEISESWFGYRTLIPLGLFPVFTTIGMVLPLAAVAFACTFAVYLIYRRGFHLRKWDWITIGALTAYGLILVPILSAVFNP